MKFLDEYRDAAPARKLAGALARAATEVQRAEYPISTTTRRAATIPGLQYQYFSQPRVTRSGVYDNFFPSASAKYAIRPNLQAQFGYAYAISRPPIDALSGAPAALYRNGNYGTS